MIALLILPPFTPLQSSSLVAASAAHVELKCRTNGGRDAASERNKNGGDVVADLHPVLFPFNN